MRWLAPFVMLGALSGQPISADTIQLPSADRRAAQMSMVFGPEGALYVAYIAKTGTRPATYVRAFDGTTGKDEIRPPAEIPNARPAVKAIELSISPDGKFLLYVEAYEESGKFLAVLEATTLRLVSSRDLKTLEMRSPVVFGFKSDSSGVEIASPIGVQDVWKPLTASIHVVTLASADLSQVLSEQKITNPYRSYYFSVDPAGHAWFSKDEGLPKSLALYTQGLSDRPRDISVDGVYGFSQVVFLNGEILALTDEYDQKGPLGRIVRFAADSVQAAGERTITPCGFTNRATPAISSDHVVGAVICEAKSQAEWNFGYVTTRKAVVFGTRSLDVLTSIEMAKHIPSRSLAVWHGKGEVRLAVPRSAQAIELHHLKSHWNQP